MSCLVPLLRNPIAGLSGRARLGALTGGITVLVACVLGVSDLMADPGGDSAEAADRPGPPWGTACAVELRAYEDRSASLYCRGSGEAFGAVDAESGRVRIEHYSQAIPSPSASRRWGSRPLTEIGPSTSAQSTSGG